MKNWLKRKNTFSVLKHRSQITDFFNQIEKRIANGNFRSTTIIQDICSKFQENLDLCREFSEMIFTSPILCAIIFWTLQNGPDLKYAASCLSMGIVNGTSFRVTIVPVPCQVLFLISRRTF
jgi:hypothetical protein